ncbi:MAG: hypothetical protein LCI00_17185 [Chloroflexi bacterium]|nr:hypothetical protein [Chloroflexota bacterium]
MSNITKVENVMPPLDTTPAISIEDLHFWLQGSVEIKPGGWFSSKDKIGRGFCFAFCLDDANGKETSDDGQLTIVLNASNTTYGPDESIMKHHAEGGGYNFYRSKLLIKKTDFMTDQSRKYEKNRNKKMYVHKHLQSSIYIEEDLNIYLHLWFQITEGKLLYKRSDGVNWGNN